MTTLPVVQRGDVKLLGWVGDETPWELGSAFAAIEPLKTQAPKD